MDKERREQIVRALEGRGVTFPCPRCGHGRFDLVDESALSIQTQPGVFNIGGPAIPFVIIACANCAFLTHHALGPLGLMPKEATNG